MNQAKNKGPQSKNLMSCVRFDDDEYFHISHDKESTGLSIPTLLKKSYFGEGKRALLMNVTVAKSLVTQLKRIGNNINQIARHVNSGGNADVSNEVLECRKSINKIEDFMRTCYGNC